jgi:outer membrane protein OmpA-like peptidoglycan-associated protein
MRSYVLAFRLAVPAVLVGVAVACGHNEPPKPVSPGVTSMQTPNTLVARRAAPNPPNTPTAATVHISEDILRACNIPDADAYFEFDSSRLTDFDAVALGSLATCFNTGPMAGHRMSLVGHADPRGSADYNITLGQARADAVAGYLAQRGLLARRDGRDGERRNRVGARPARGRDAREVEDAGQRVTLQR